MKFYVADDRILAEKIDTESTEQKSTFYIPETVDKKYLEATIIGVGDNVSAYKVGDRIFLSKQAGFQFKYDKKEMVMANVKEIMAKLVED